MEVRRTALGLTARGQPLAVGQFAGVFSWLGGAAMGIGEQGGFLLECLLTRSPIMECN